MPTFFTKGHSAAQLADALAEPNRILRQEKMNAMNLPGPRRIVSPQAGYGNTDTPPVPGTPSNESVRTSGELALLGLIVLLRNVPLADINEHPIAIRGAQMLADFGKNNRLLMADGPNGLFRMNPARVGADRIGKLIYAKIPTGWGEPFSFATRTRIGEYGGNYAAWEALQSGRIPEPQRLAAGAAIPVTLRDIGSFAHQDSPGFIGRCVMEILVAANAPRSTRFPVAKNEDAFVGPGGIWEMAGAMGQVMLAAGEHAWHLKSTVFRRPRPEELWPEACRGELNEAFLRLAGWIVDQIGHYLPMPLAAGSPLHSADPSGHAVDAGVWGTILKVWFANGSVPSLGIEHLHEEIDLMMWHMTMGRGFDGIHYQRDMTSGLRIGEKYALEYLRRQNVTSPQFLGITAFFGVDGKLIVLDGTP
jgi:hypothetical protein